MHKSVETVFRRIAKHVLYCCKFIKKNIAYLFLSKSAKFYRKYDKKIRRIFLRHGVYYSERDAIVCAMT